MASFCYVYMNVFPSAISWRGRLFSNVHFWLTFDKENTGFPIYLILETKNRMVKLKPVCNFFLTEAILGTKWQLCTCILAFPVYALSLHIFVGEILSRYLSLSFQNSFGAVFLPFVHIPSCLFSSFCSLLASFLYFCASSHSVQTIYYPALLYGT